MREIKFRFWDRFKKEMFAVYNLKGDSATGVLCSLDLGIEKIPCSIGNGNLMQYTGLKDKNGKEIYEGDIVLFDADYTPIEKEAGWLTGLIEWDQSGARFHFIYKGAIKDVWYDLVEEQDEPMEVIGNIYENPELEK